MLVELVSVAEGCWGVCGALEPLGCCGLSGPAHLEVSWANCSSCDPLDSSRVNGLRRARSRYRAGAVGGNAIPRPAQAARELQFTGEVDGHSRPGYGTERMRQKLFVVGSGVLVNTSTPPAPAELVAWGTQSVGNRLKERSKA